MKANTTHEPDQTIQNRRALALSVAKEMRRVPYSKRAIPSVIEVIELMEALRKADAECERVKHALGEAQFNEAIAKWCELSGWRTRCFGGDTVPQVVQEHPEVDPDVFRWLGQVAETERLATSTLSQVGREVCSAFYRSDIGFFESLLCTFESYSPTLKRAQLLKKMLLLEKLSAGGPQLNFRSYYELTKEMRHLCRRPELQLGYVKRLCKDMGLCVKGK